jgi:hypothetical protein
VRIRMLVVGVPLMLIALSGCAASVDDPTLTGTPAASSTVVVATPTPIASSSTTFGSPTSDLARFNEVNAAVVAAHPKAGGRTFIDALVRAGFPKSAMQVTEDRTTIGLAVPSVQFSVLTGGRCLIGQYGPHTGGYKEVTAPPTGGACLIGKTRTIDW